MSANRSQLTLPETERQYLWDVEHHGSLLSKHGFSSLVRALETRQIDELTRLCSNDFKGLVPTEATPRVATKQADLSAERWLIDESSTVEVSSTEYASWLLDTTSRLGDTVHAKASLMAFKPSERSHLESPWQGRCRLRLWSSGPHTDSNQALGEITLQFEFTIQRPTEMALESGGWLESANIVALKQAHSPHALMLDVASEMGVDVDRFHDNWQHGASKTIPQPGGVYVCDYNRDGHLDLYVTDITLPSGGIFYEGQPDFTFKDVTDTIGLPLKSSGRATFADLDNDGWVDLVQSDGQVFRNQEGKGFRGVSHLSNLAKVGQLYLTRSINKILPADYDLDGDLDLYVCRSAGALKGGSWVDGKIVDRHRNQLLRNDGDWQFTDVTSETQTDGGGRSVFSAVWFDANNDMRPDIYVIHEFGNGVLLINEPDGTFRSVAISDRPADFGSMGVTCGDYNNDGKIDLYVASMYSKSGARVIGNLRPDAYEPRVMDQLRRMVGGNQLYGNAGQDQFHPKAEQMDVHDIGWAYGPAFVDLNNDGLLDLHATGGFISRTRAKPDG